MPPKIYHNHWFQYYYFFWVLLCIALREIENEKNASAKFGRQTKFSFMANQKGLNPVILTIITILNAFNFYLKPWKCFGL